MLENISAVLKKPKNIEKAIRDLIAKNTELSKEIDVLNKDKAGLIKKDLKKKMTTVNGINFFG